MLKVYKTAKGGRQAYKNSAGIVHIECRDCEMIKKCGEFYEMPGGFLGKDTYCSVCSRVRNDKSNKKKEKEQKARTDKDYLELSANLNCPEKNEPEEDGAMLDIVLEKIRAYESIAKVNEYEGKKGRSIHNNAYAKGLRDCLIDMKHIKKDDK